ncbi:MAG TPA: hypothetical protein VG939_14075 [Caulobacteraceae bacterium]|nr:hypothetical protein [Caulobacteraceae bacterium]
MPAMLTHDRFAAARAFIAGHARPLDAALYRHRFEGGEAGAILAALVPFQNPDGGFGHGLEPDIATPASTAIATSVGLRTLRRAGVDAGHPMVAGAARWLESHVADGVWPIIGPEVDQAPHAPWWGWSNELADSWNGFRWNPTAEILADLYRFRAAVPALFLDAVEARMRRSIREADVIEGAYDLRCATILAETPEAPADLREALANLLVRSVRQHDPDDEHAPVLDLAPTPQSLLAPVLEGRIDHAAEVLIDGQQDDGGWSPFWDWAFVDEAAWARAKADWRGGLTRLALESLAGHGRIEGLAAAA